MAGAQWIVEMSHSEGVNKGLIVCVKFRSTVDYDFSLELQSGRSDPKSDQVNWSTVCSCTKSQDRATQRHSSL